MWRSSILFLSLVISATAIAEEPRWCSVSSRDPSNTVHYAPIAAAAQVQGEARAQIIYKPNGKVQKIEHIAGALMLSQPLENQLMNWTVRSNAPGDESCQTLVIATFALRKHGSGKFKFTTESNVIHIFVSKHRPEIVVESDAASEARQGF